jgi:hypothetical protein
MKKLSVTENITLDGVIDAVRAGSGSLATARTADASQP